jgi:hypothetical protein
MMKPRRPWKDASVDQRPRNPLRSEADMFRVLLMFVVAGAAVVAVALLVSSLAGFLLGVVLLGIGVWRAWGLVQEWRRYGSDPAER